MKEKMGFEEFVKRVANDIKACLPEEFAKANVRLNTVMKNNSLKLTGLSIQVTDGKLTPMIYLDSFYKKYTDGAEMSEILKTIAELRTRCAGDDLVDASDFTSFKMCKDKIFPRLVSTAWNKAELADRPHMTVADLAVTYVVDLGDHDGGRMSIQIQNSLQKLWGVSTEEIHEVAIRNLSNAENGTFKPLNEMLNEMMFPNILDQCLGDEVIAKEMIENMLPPDDRMWVLSNNDSIFGSSYLLDRKMMERVVEQIGEDFVILPSSVHECILVRSEQGMSKEDFENMVREVNSTQVDIVDRLSDSVYRYKDGNLVFA